MWMVSNETKKWKEGTRRWFKWSWEPIVCDFPLVFCWTRAARTQKTISHLNRSLPNGLIWFSLSLSRFACLWQVCRQCGLQRWTVHGCCAMCCVRACACAFAVLLLLLYLILLRFTADLCWQSNKVRIRSQTHTRREPAYRSCSLHLDPNSIWAEHTDEHSRLLTRARSSISFDFTLRKQVKYVEAAAMTTTTTMSKSLNRYDIQNRSRWHIFLLRAYPVMYVLTF